ncbi:hypothetical protein [Bacillus paranthracis]
MNIRQLALQNIKGNWRNYKVFFCNYSASSNKKTGQIHVSDSKT